MPIKLHLLYLFLLKFVKVKLDNPLAQLRYFLQDDLYLLKTDQDVYRKPQAQQPVPPVAAIPEIPADTNPVITEQTPAITFKYLGDNQKHFLVLCHYPAVDYMADAHLTALISTVTRLNYTQQDLAIVNLAHYPTTDWQQLADFFTPQKLLILGSKAQPDGLPKLVQNETDQADGCQALYTFSFDEMIGQKENTKAFWNQIKTF